MLRRNINVTAGLVNGAIGTILDIFPSRVSIKFDHIKVPCDIERVRGKFLVLKTYYVYRTQFPLMLAYAVTIHKCQGLSLDCAIVDLSAKVFADGMAYVALSRVRSIDGLHLTAFTPKSIRVNTRCLEEINRLRKLYRNDLPQYDIPFQTASTKRKLTGTCEDEEPPLKKPCRVYKKRKVTPRAPLKQPSLLPNKRKLDVKSGEGAPPSKCIRTNSTPQGNRVWPFRFHSVDDHWQRNICLKLGLTFTSPNGVSRGSPDMPLTRPDMRKTKRVLPDGNCMFRSLSRVVTGSQTQHKEIRSVILKHMQDIAPLMLGHIEGRNSYNSVDEYIEKSKMENDMTWGTDLELLCFAHLTNTCVFTYCVESSNWARYGPHNVDRSLPVDLSVQSIYLCHPPGHYDLVGCTVNVPTSNVPHNNADRSKPNSDPKSTPTPNGNNTGKKTTKPKPSDRRPNTGRSNAARAQWTAGMRNLDVFHGLIYHPVDEQWQREKCTMLNLSFCSRNGLSPGGPSVPLTHKIPLYESELMEIACSAASLT